MVDVCSNPALMFNFTPSVPGVAYVDLTREEDTIKVPPLKRNIAPPQRMTADDSNIIPDYTSSVREESWGHVA